MPAAYLGTDIISYFHEVEIYHTALAVYHIAWRYIIKIYKFIVVYKRGLCQKLRKNRLLSLSFEFHYFLFDQYVIQCH